MKIKDFGDDIKIVYGCIYVFRNKLNGKCYVGRTINPEKRYKRHLADSKYGDNLLFHKAIRKYGIENFDYFIVYGNDLPIETVKEVLTEQEIKYIKLFDSYKNGYNMTEGGEGWGVKDPWNKGKKTGPLTKVHSDKISNSLLGHPFYGLKTHETTVETREKISKANTGRKATYIAKQHMSESHLGKPSNIKGRHRVYREDGTFYMSK